MSRANAWRSYLSLTAKEVLGISGRMRCHSWRASCDFVDVVTGSESQQPLRFGYVSVATRQIRQSAHTHGIHLRGKKFSAGRPSTCLFLLADSVKCLSPSYEAGVCHITLQASLLSQEDASDASIAVAFHLHDQAPLLGSQGELISSVSEPRLHRCTHTARDTGHPGPGKWVMLKNRNCLLSFRNVFKQQLGALVSC